MPEILITVRDKIAQLANRSVVVCDNTDYVAVFDFDEEWDAYPTKTAQFNFGGLHIPVVFDGAECPMPQVSEASVLRIGVYAGDLHTTTSALVPCLPSIRSGEGAPADPADDVYDQIMQKLNDLSEIGEEEIAAAVEAYLEAHPVEAPQADWSVNDPSDPAYVKGRTHWEDETTVHPLDLKYIPDSVKPLTVTITYDEASDTYSADKTFAEIKAAHDAGRVVQAEIGEGAGLVVFQLFALDDSVVLFVSSDYSSCSLVIIESDNSVELSVSPLSPVTSVNGKEGDVELTAEDVGAMSSTGPVATGSFSMGRKAGTTVGSMSHAEGYDTEASGRYSHAEGSETEASGQASHAEGSGTKASGLYSHAEGGLTEAYGWYSHAEGSYTEAIGNSSHAEGYDTEARGSYSHAEGYETKVSGNNSHAEGEYTKASASIQHVEGAYNIEDSNLPGIFHGQYVHIVGNGESDTVRSNAHTLDWDGNAWFAGNVYVGSTSGTNRDDGSKKLATEDSIPTALPNPNKLTFTGAVEAEYDGSEAVSVEIPAGDTSLGVTGASVGQTVKITAVDDAGVPTAWEAVDMGGGKSWRKIADITLEEDATEILVDTDEDGNALSLQAMTVRAAFPAVEAASSGTCWGYIGGSNNCFRTIFNLSLITSSVRATTAFAYFFPDSIWGMCDNAPLSSNMAFGSYGYGTLYKLVSRTDGFVFPAGSRLVIYGIDA